MKKIISGIMILALAISTTTPAFAHSGRNKGQRRQENTPCSYGYECPDHEECPRDGTCDYYQNCLDGLCDHDHSSAANAARQGRGNGQCCR